MAEGVDNFIVEKFGVEKSGDVLSITRFYTHTKKIILRLELLKISDRVKVFELNSCNYCI